jgi:hypothetical protein
MLKFFRKSRFAPIADECLVYPLLFNLYLRLKIYIPLRIALLRRIFGPKRDEVIGGWRILHNEELHNL